MSNAKLAVLTVNYNKSDYTIKLLKSLCGSTFEDIKFFVVDNQSNKHEIFKLKDGCSDSPIDTKIIYNDTNPGWGPALNRGFKQINKENIPYTLVINNDTMVDAQAIEKMMTFMDSNKEVGICGPKILDEYGNIQTTGGKLDWLVKLFGITRDSNNGNLIDPYILSDKETLDDCAWLIRSYIFEILKYPDYIFLYFEELYIVLGVRKGGCKLAYLPKAVVSHIGQASSKEKYERKSKIQIFYLNRNRLIFLKDNYPKLFPLSVVLITLVTIPLIIIKAALKREFKEIPIILKGWWSGMQYASFLNKITYFKNE